MQLHLLHVHDTAIGYARYGVKLAAHLEKMGVKVDDELGPESTPKHLVCWVSTPTHAAGWFDGQYPIISTMWESQALPEPFREALHNFRQIIVPSDQNLELFSRYHPNVAKVPLGVDTEKWAYRPRVMPTDTFRFLIGGSGSRKGQDLAYKAFRKVFKTWPKGQPTPILQFKSPRSVDFLGERIEMITGRITDQAEVDLYGAAHCYLQPSRGEGFGLQPLQAIAQGLPTILTNAHGHAEYAHLGYGISAKSHQSDYFIYGDAGDWWEPDLDELCERMEYVYMNYPEACRRAEEMSPLAHEWFSWERCAENFMAAVGEEHFKAEYKGSYQWFKPEYKRFLTMVSKPWAAEIAGKRLQFMPGKEYWEVADVKRILWEAEVLDPKCIIKPDGNAPTAAETGLTEAQLAHLGQYSATQSYCWSCGQMLNSGKLYEP